MKTNKLTFCVSILLFAQPLLAQNAQTKITSEAMSVIRQNLNDMDVSSCYNLSRSDFEMKFKSSLEAFFKEDGTQEYIKEEIAYQGEDAIVNLAAEASDFAQYHLMEQLGLDEDEFYECQEELVQQTYANADYGNNYQEEIDDYLKYMGGSISDSDVGLPVYKNSSLVSYMNEEQSEQMLKQLYPGINGPFLSSVVYFSNDDFDKIISFYEGELRGFKKGNIGANSIGFTAEDYDFDAFLSLEGIKKWSVMESVWVEKLTSSDQGKVKIEIHWE